jgi:ketosteroid isomerase-like protein
MAPRALALLVLAGACARTPTTSSPEPTTAPASTPAVTTDPVVAAERAFAADGLALGFKASFLKHSAGDAIVIQGDPVNAHENLAKVPDPVPGQKQPALVWWPLWAGIARSGDLGFTTGPFTLDGKPIGHYFTVWKKQPDGSWKWVFDAGVDADPAGQPPPGSPAGSLPLAAAGSASPDAAAAEVKAAEAELARLAASDLAGATVAYMADDGRVHTDGMRPATTRDAFAAALARRARAMELRYVGGGASQAGDMVWTYGEARWTDGDQARRGHYVRMWQKRREGWRIVFDELVPPRSTG